MQFLKLYLLLFLSPHVIAQPRGSNRHATTAGTTREEVRLNANDSSYKKSKSVGKQDLYFFFRDTLRSDSFFTNNFSNYALPKTQKVLVNESNNTSQLQPQLKSINSPNWVFIVVISIVTLLLFIKFSFTKLYGNALLSFFNRAATADIINDKYSPRWLFVLFANLFFIGVISLWISRVFLTTEAPMADESPGRFYWIFIIIFLVYFVKFLIHLLSGALFQITDAIIIYILNVSITNLICGMVMLFSTLLLVYSPWHEQQWLINTSFGIMIVFILLRYLRGLQQTMKYFKYNYLYLILYLCTLEIAPWFLMIKYLNNYL